MHNGRVYLDWEMDENGKFTGLFREYKGWHRLSCRLSLYGFRYIRVGSTFDDRALAQLRAFPEVEYLDVGYTLSTDQGLEALGRSGHMRHLKSLELSHTKVTDRDLVHLTGFPALTRLYLDGTAITDAGVAILGQLENLRSLDVEDTSITASGIQAIRRANPRINLSPYRGESSSDDGRVIDSALIRM